MQPDPNSEVLVVDRNDAVATVRLNRPDALNATDHALHTRLADVWGELAADRALRCVVVTGTGRAFSAGGDLGLLLGMHENPEVRDTVLGEAARIVRSLVSFPLPVIAAVNGPAVGLGCSLAAFCDVVLIERSAYLADPHVSVGLVAGDGGALAWPALTSLLRAKEYIYSGDRITADEAVRLGLANRVVDDGTSVTEALALARRLARQPPYALQATKRLLNSVVEQAVASTLDFALAAESVSVASEAHGEIIRKMLKASGSSR